MSDLSTFAGQAEHYAGVRARLFARPLQVPAPVNVVPEPVPEPEETPYGAPINLVCAPNARNIIKLVALSTGTRFDDIVGPRRDRALVAVRKRAIHLVYSHCPHLSLPMMGHIFNRDHTSILFALGRVKKGLSSAA